MVEQPCLLFDWMASLLAQLSTTSDDQRRRALLTTFSWCMSANEFIQLVTAERRCRELKARDFHLSSREPAKRHNVKNG